MAFINTLDIVDEDAADLQFPKGEIKSSTCFVKMLSSY